MPILSGSYQPYVLGSILFYEIVNTCDDNILQDQVAVLLTLWGSYLCLVVTIRQTSRALPNVLITGQHYFNGSSISCRDNIFHGSSGRIQETLRRHQFLYGMMRYCGNVTGPYVLYSTEGIQNNRLHVTAPSLYFNICNVLWGLSLFRVL